MLNIIGIVVIALGFFALPISAGFVSPIIFFWLGFLFLLSQSSFITADTKWNRYARWGMMVHVLIVLIGIVYFSLLFNPATAPPGSNIFTSSFFWWISSPASGILPSPSPQFMPDGTYITRLSLFRISITSFLDVIIYLALGVVVGSLIHIIKREKETV